MRKKWLSFAGLLGLVVLLNPDATHGQPPGGFGGKGGFDRGGKGGFDRGGKGGFDRGGSLTPGGPGGPPSGGFGGPPGGGKGGFGGTDAEKAERMWGFISRGADTIDLSKMDDNQKRFLTSMFERNGMPAPPPNAVISKQQFVGTVSQAMAARAASAGTPGAPGAPGLAPGSVPPGGPPGFGGPPGMTGRGGPPSDAEAEERFRRYDLNQDGRVSREEAAQSGSRFMSGSFEQMDTNRDGFIDLNEYKAFRASMSRGGPGGPGGPPGMTPPPGYGPPTGYVPQPGEQGYSPDRRDPRREKEKEPEVIAVRYGKLPNGLPDWWTELDTDKDGQVGLYEWRQSGKPLVEFREMDLDGDGLISPAEYFAFERVKEEKDRKAAADEGIDRPGRSRAGSSGGSSRGSAGSDQGGSGYRGAWGGNGGGSPRGPGGPPGRPETKGGDSKGGDRTDTRGESSEGKGKGKGKKRDRGDGN